LEGRRTNTLRPGWIRGAYLRRDERGFTLPEALVTMMIMLTVMFALYSIFDMSLRVFSFGNDKTEAVENARLGLEKMERELRAAYPYDKAGMGGTVNEKVIAGGIATNPSNSIIFGNDLDGDRQIASDTATEEITYTLSGDTLQRNSQPVVGYVKPGGLTFEYLDKNGCRLGDAGCPSLSEPNIYMVRIKLEVEVKRGSQAGTQTLTTDVALRNRVQ
jgi:prepilin-type N-terminal cleavage/methylation domain-containing protein